MAWIIKLKTKLNDNCWYVTKINRKKTDCQVTSNRYGAKVYSQKHFFKDFIARLNSDYEIIEIKPDEVCLYDEKYSHVVPRNPNNESVEN
jgi:hypothetical protein